MEVSGFILKKLRETLQNVFINLYEFKRFLVEELNLNLSEIPTGESEADFFFNTIEYITAEGKIEKLLKKVDRVKKEKKEIKEFYQIYRLAEILNQINEFGKIKSIYLQTLGNIDDLELKEVNDINELLENLTDFPPRPNLLSKLLEFFLRKLNSVKQELNLDETLLEEWIKKYAPNLDIEAIEPSQKLQAYLLITIAPETTKDFRLNAELIPDYLSHPQQRQAIYSDSEDVKSEEEQQPQSILEKWSKTISEFVQKAENHLYGCSYDLTIELFLPWQYLGEKFDLKLKFIDKYGKERFLSEKYPIIIRSYERNSEANDLSKLLQRRNKINEMNPRILPTYCLDVQDLTLFNNWEEVAYSWDTDEKLGIKLLCCLPSAKNDLRENFFKAVLDGGILVALWSRCDELPHVNLKDALNNILSCSCLKNLNQLYKSVARLRQEAHTKKNNAPNYLGYHLGVLCDEPRRIPSYLNPPKLRIGR